MIRILLIFIVLLVTTTIFFHRELQTLQLVTTNQISDLKTQLEETNLKLLNLTRENELLKEKINNLNLTLEETKNELAALRDRFSRNFLVNPTYNEVLNFVREDDTDKIPFNETNYSFICTDYTNRFISNFRKKGFYACETILYFPNHQSHSIVAINTTDKGLIFVEPQNDQIIFNLRVGDNYCNYINQDCNWTILSIKHCFNH